MPRTLRTAIAAVALPSIQKQTIRALARANVTLEAMVSDGHSAVKALQRFRPDLFLADMQLPGIEGYILAERVLASRSLPVRPSCIVLHHAEFVLPRRSILEEAGVIILEKPLTGEALQNAVRMLENSPPFFPESEQKTADRLLDELGVPNHIGRSCLRTAALLCAGDERFRHSLMTRLYPAAGEICGVSAAQAERAMRHAIGLAWQSNKFENQYRIFGDTVDAGRGQPTCGEMILRLADILRLEG